MAKTREKLLDKTGGARPYVERALTDQDLRDNLRNAWDSARHVYDELREAAERVQGKKQHGARNTMLLLTGIGLGILFNPVTGPQTRKWLSDTMLGSSDDFTYKGDGGTSS